MYLEKNPKLKVKVVDGSSLAVAAVLNSIPKGTSKVLFRGRLSKVAYSIVSTLCYKGIQVNNYLSLLIIKVDKTNTAIKTHMLMAISLKFACYSSFQ